MRCEYIVDEVSKKNVDFKYLKQFVAVGSLWNGIHSTTNILIFFSHQKNVNVMNIYEKESYGVERRRVRFETTRWCQHSSLNSGCIFQQSKQTI